MDNRKRDSMFCGNCKHEIVLEKVKLFNNKYKYRRSQTVNVKHAGNSYLCLVNNCQCLDPTGRDTALVGSRYPFNKFSEMVTQ